MIVAPDDNTINNLYFNVIEVEPADKVITIDTDVEIFFKAPLNYFEPPPQLSYENDESYNGNGIIQISNDNTQNTSNSTNTPSSTFVPFSGQGHRLGGD